MTLHFYFVIEKELTVQSAIMFLLVKYVSTLRLIEAKIL